MIMRSLDKKGQGTPIWIIIALVLGILVLVIIALGFTQGWGKLWGKLTSWTGEADSLSDAEQACNVAAAASDTPALNQVRDVEGLSDDNLRKLDDSLKLEVPEVPAVGNTPKVDAVAAGPNADKLGSEDIDLGNGITISKDKVVSGITCEVLKSKGLITY